jgi:hypothetical protein
MKKLSFIFFVSIFMASTSADATRTWILNPDIKKLEEVVKAFVSKNVDGFGENEFKYYVKLVKKRVAPTSTYTNFAQQIGDLLKMKSSSEYKNIYEGLKMASLRIARKKAEPAFIPDNQVPVPIQQDNKDLSMNDVSISSIFQEDEIRESLEKPSCLHIQEDPSVTPTLNNNNSDLRMDYNYFANVPENNFSEPTLGGVGLYQAKETDNILTNSTETFYASLNPALFKSENMNVVPESLGVHNDFLFLAEENEKKESITDQIEWNDGYSFDNSKEFELSSSCDAILSAALDESLNDHPFNQNNDETITIEEVLPEVNAAVFALEPFRFRDNAGNIVDCRQLRGFTLNENKVLRAIQEIYAFSPVMNEAEHYKISLNKINCMTNIKKTKIVSILNKMKKNVFFEIRSRELFKNLSKASRELRMDNLAKKPLCEIESELFEKSIEIYSSFSAENKTQQIEKSFCAIQAFFAGKICVTIHALIHRFQNILKKLKNINDEKSFIIHELYKYAARKSKEVERKEKIVEKLNEEEIDFIKDVLLAAPNLTTTSAQEEFSSAIPLIQAFFKDKMDVALGALNYKFVNLAEKLKKENDNKFIIFNGLYNAINADLKRKRLIKPLKLEEISFIEEIIQIAPFLVTTTSRDEFERGVELLQNHFKDRIKTNISTLKSRFGRISEKLKNTNDDRWTIFHELSKAAARLHERSRKPKN